MTNGENDWNVKFSRITFFEKVLHGHDNVRDFYRSEDILFTIERDNPDDVLRILCCDEYTAGMDVVLRALDEFGDLSIIFIGGNWNGYTKDAKEYCLNNGIGLYNSKEINGALWMKDYHKYVVKDEKGNPVYCYTAA